MYIYGFDRYCNFKKHDDDNKFSKIEFELLLLYLVSFNDMVALRVDYHHKQ